MNTMAFQLHKIKARKTNEATEGKKREMKKITKKTDLS